MTRIFIAGAGFIGRAHAEGAKALGPDVQLFVADPSEASRAAFLAAFPDAQTFADPTEMLEIPAQDGDVIVVATPPASHAKLTRMGFASGRNVLCDKPLGVDAEAGRAMLAAARAAGKTLGDSSNRFLGYASTERARELVRSGSLGDIYHATICHRRARMRSGIEYQPETRWFLDRAKSGGGVMMDWGVYDLTTFFHVLAPVKVEVLQAWMRKPPTGADPEGIVFDIETHVGATMRMVTEAGHTVIVDYERASASQGAERMIMEIDGMDRSVRWDWIPWLKEAKGEVALREDRAGKASEQIETFDLSTGPHFHHRPLTFFIGALRGDDARAVLNERALFGFEVVCAIYDVAADGKPRSVTLADI